MEGNWAGVQPTARWKSAGRPFPSWDCGGNRPWGNILAEEKQELTGNISAECSASILLGVITHLLFGHYAGIIIVTGWLCSEPMWILVGREQRMMEAKWGASERAVPMFGWDTERQEWD